MLLNENLPLATKSDYSVYLGGPINGLTFSEANEWRRVAAFHLAKHNIQVRSPLRNKEQTLQNSGKLSGDLPDTLFTQKKTIYHRDKHDIKLADAALFNFPESEWFSFGTSVELGWATAWDKFTTLILPKNNTSIRNHAFTNDLPVIIVEKLEDALTILVDFFHGGI